MNTIKNIMSSAKFISQVVWTTKLKQLIVIELIVGTIITSLVLGFKFYVDYKLESEYNRVDNATVERACDYLEARVDEYLAKQQAASTEQQ